MDEYSILKKKQKKNGFAATSLLISIAIALLALVGAVLILGKVNDNGVNTADESSTVAEIVSKNDETCEGLNKEIVFNNNLKSIKEAAISYFTNERLPKTIDETVKISLKEMKDKKLVLNIRDASAKTCDENDSYVEVTKEKDEYIMKVFLACSDIEDYIIVHLGCYDYCDSNVCEKKEEPVVKEYEYEYKKTNSCVMSPWSDWGNWKTTREKTSNLKKEDIKTEVSTKTVVDTINATKNVTYNCNKYSGYTLVGDKCVKETTSKDIKDATPSKYSYNCDKYPGYSVVGSKCVKETSVKEIIDATQNKITYSCQSGYTLNGTKCEKMVSKTDTKSGSYVCQSGYTLSGTKCTKTTTSTDTKSGSYVCPSGYTLSGTKCIITTSSTSTVGATAVYSTRTYDHTFTCYRNICTTKTVFSCPSGKSCGNYPQTSCEKIKTTCTRPIEESYISGYSCPNGYSLSGTTCIMTITNTDTKDATFTCPSGYNVNNGKCSKTTTSTDTKNATFTCSSGYSISSGKCIKSYQEKVTINATQNPVTYSCKSGYTLNGKKCERTVTKTDIKDATKVPGGYVCQSGYTLNGTKCTKTTTIKDTKDASTNIKYSCNSGYTLSDKTCTKKVNKDTKITYYRYATRSCNGGSTDIRWSTSKNDSILTSEGYKLTGNKRELIIK